MWYGKTVKKKVFVRKLGKREKITVSTEGYETAPDRTQIYQAGDYIVYEEGKGISFRKADEFLREYEYIGP